MKGSILKRSMKCLLAGLSLVIMVLIYTGWGGPGLIFARQLSEADFKTTPLVRAKATAAGFSFDKGMTSISLADNIQSVAIKNRNGSIEIKQSNGSTIEIHTTVVVDQAGEKEASAVAEKTELRVKEGKALDIEAYSERYGRNHHKEASIHLTVTLPKKLAADLQANVSNGNISLSKVLSIGRVKLSSANGNVDAKGIGNNITLRSDNGTIHVSDAEQAVQATVMNGDIVANQIAGPLGMETMNGNLSSKEAGSTIEAVSSTGNIRIESRKVGGNWAVSSNVGNVYLAWPGSAEVEVDGKTAFGEPQTDFPLAVKNNHVTGTVGKGTYRIEASSMAGLSLMKAR